MADEVCSWRDMTLLPHLINLFSKRGIGAHVAFSVGEPHTIRASRKEFARELHKSVSELNILLHPETSPRPW